MLKSAYFEFSSGPQLVFWGPRKQLGELSRCLLAASASPEPMYLGSFVQSVDGKQIAIEQSARCEGLKRSAFGFEWRLSPEVMHEFADKIDVMIESDQPCHQYLECRLHEDAVVVVSWGEYPDDMKPDA